MDGTAKSGPKADVPRGTVPDRSEESKAPPGSEEQFDPQKLFRELEPSVREMADWIGRDTPQGQKLLSELEWETSAIARPTKPNADGTRLVDLRLLEPSPLHHRTNPSPQEQAVLEQSIAAEGLKHPIEVRPSGEKFQIICGHRRVDAYRSLFHRATTDSERAKYKAIRAKVLPASDLEAVRSGIADDLVREEFPPADAARSIHMLRHFEPALSSAQKLADATGLPFKRVARYLQLGKAPLMIQAAVRDGMTVEVEGEDGSLQEEDRKLDLRAGLELDRLHAALSEKEGAGERNADGGDGSAHADTDADRKTQQAIERALLENWGFREVKRYVDKAIAALRPRAPKMGRPRVPFKWSNRWLQVDVDQVGALDASQKELLRTVMREIEARL